MRTTLIIALAGTALFATPAFAQNDREAGDWLVRARAILVTPNEESGAVTGIAGSGATVDDDVMPEVDFTYFVTRHIGAELILATTKHNVNGAGSIAGLGRIASSRVLPPTLTLQYHFAPGGAVHPYVGAGVNYTIFYSEKATSSLNTALGATTIDMEDSAGYALQAGVDIDVGHNLFINADVKYIDMDTTATLRSGATVRTLDVSIDPIVASVGVGVKF
ncbi:OmpW family protein [Sphingomonas sp. LB-2]|uniref:OmpW/AlkL family protein n=1 Tax=Sphingomonas caeni TaxID=2984949 RepID=UPI00222F6BE8|nr:OmpW family protein [Sphingomonas caeni]MCW3847659.1 OmpW family protein [Sphingomonas caeni]